MGSQGKNTEVVCHSLLQLTIFCPTSPPWPVRLGWPHTAGLSFTELDKAVVCMIRLASFLWLWFQCACPLMPSPSTYHLTWSWGISYFGRGVSLHGCSFKPSHCSLLWTSHPSWPWTWSKSIGPPVPAQPPLFGHGVALLGRRPWPRALGSSSRRCFLRGPSQPPCFLRGPSQPTILK